jgi:hypothetical protein
VIRDSSVGIVTMLRAECKRNYGSFPSRATNFHLFQSSQIAPRAHSASYSTGNAGSFLGSKAAGCKSTTYPYLLPRLTLDGAMPPLPTYFYCVHWDLFTFTTPIIFRHIHIYIYIITTYQGTTVVDSCWADQETSRLLRNRKIH